MAEGVVVMVCPVLLALALDKVDLKVYGGGAFMAMLTMAGFTLISGICPMLVFCFSQRFPGVPEVLGVPNVVMPAWVRVTLALATLSYSCLLVLTCLIAQLIVSKKILIPVGVLCGGFVLVWTVWYYHGQNVIQDEQHGQNVIQDEQAGLHNILDESHEFLTGVTGILFLGLEGLVLESHGNQMFPKGCGAVCTISFILCAVGVCLMYFEMTPPPQFDEEVQIVVFTLVLDILMAAGTFALLIVAMFKLMGVPALVLFTPPVVIIGELAYRVTIEGLDREGVNNNENQQGPNVAIEVPIQVPIQVPIVPAPASLELTRVTFTGFLAVSITAISNTSTSMLTVCFLLFVAVAIMFGISWRLLTQSQIRSGGFNVSAPQVASSANLASFCTHFSILIATILFLAMAGKARGK